MSLLGFGAFGRLSGCLFSFRRFASLGFFAFLRNINRLAGREEKQRVTSYSTCASFFRFPTFTFL